MSDENKAVFLSYAREDSDAARRIAEALRAAGVEVWFDQSELRGGDAWDVSIRKQIRDCALFVPIVSAHTQTRAEGYFRLEWHLAEQRSLLIAKGRPFIVPICVDGTSERYALVPEAFLAVQWTRVPDGKVTTAFPSRVRALLGLESGTARDEVAAPKPGEMLTRFVTSKHRSVWIWAAVGIAAVVVTLITFVGKQKGPARASATSNPETHSPKRTDSAPLSAVSSAVSLAKADAKSVAVLPFANLSPDPENAFFADGVHEDIIAHLAKIRDLKVISRTSMLVYRDAKPGSLKKIGAELGVATILEGSVRRAGNNVRVTAKLINVRTDEPLWSETYDKNLSDVFALQSALAQEIATALKVSLSASERALIERQLTQNQAAYDWYMRARVEEERLSNRASREQFERVTAMYEHSVAQDPAFTLPHLRLTLLQALMYFLGNLDPTPERRAKAQASAESAARLAPAAPETRLAQGAFAYHCDNDFARALSEFRAAEAGLPNDPDVLSLTGFLLRRLGRWREAVDYQERSATLNPRDLHVGTLLMSTTFHLRRMPQSMDLAERYLRLFPNDGLVQQNLARARYELDGDRVAYLHARGSAPFMSGDPDGLFAAYENALLAGDLVGAARALQAPRLLTIISNVDLSINEPVALHRAQVAFLQGEAGVAAREADEAIAYFRSQTWTPRQRPYVLLGIARAQAFAGRASDAAPDAQKALSQVAGHDAFAEMSLRLEAARMHAALNQREEALRLLREVLSGPCGWSPREIRFDPLLSRLKVDPRFEEILKAAKPL